MEKGWLGGWRWEGGWGRGLICVNSQWFQSAEYKEDVCLIPFFLFSFFSFRFRKLGIYYRKDYHLLPLSDHQQHHQTRVCADICLITIHQTRVHADISLITSSTSIHQTRVRADISLITSSTIHQTRVRADIRADISVKTMDFRLHPPVALPALIHSRSSQ